MLLINIQVYMKIRNEKIINKLKKSNPSPVIDEKIVIGLEDWQSELDLNLSHTQQIKKIINKYLTLIGFVFLINFFCMYFFGIAIEISDFDLIFFLLTVVLIWLVGDILLRLQIKNIFNSSIPLDQKVEAVANRNLFKGWQLYLILTAIVISTIGFAFSVISLTFEDVDLDSVYFNYSLIFFILSITLVGLVKDAETLTFVVFFFIGALCYTATNWMIEEYDINSDYDSFYLFVTEDVLGLNIEASVDDQYINNSENLEQNSINKPKPVDHERLYEQYLKELQENNAKH